jgi:hypothetical protein
VVAGFGGGLNATRMLRDEGIDGMNCMPVILMDERIYPEEVMVRRRW